MCEYRKRDVQNVQCTCSLHRSWSTFSCSSKRRARTELSTRSPSWRFRFISRLEVFCTSSCNLFSSSSAPGRYEGGETCIPRQNGHTYEAPVPPGGPQKLPTRSFPIPRVRLFVGVETLGSGHRSAPVARPPIDSRGPWLRSASLSGDHQAVASLEAEDQPQGK